MVIDVVFEAPEIDCAFDLVVMIFVTVVNVNFTDHITKVVNGISIHIFRSVFVLCITVNGDPNVYWCRLAERTLKHHGHCNDHKHELHFEGKRSSSVKLRCFDKGDCNILQSKY